MGSNWHSRPAVSDPLPEREHADGEPRVPANPDQRDAAAVIGAEVSTLEPVGAIEHQCDKQRDGKQAAAQHAGEPVER